jgi:hypothetical protein
MMYLECHSYKFTLVLSNANMIDIHTIFPAYSALRKPTPVRKLMLTLNLNSERVIRNSTLWQCRLRVVGQGRIPMFYPSLSLDIKPQIETKAARQREMLDH